MTDVNSRHLIFKILALYGGALLIGMVLVSVPASSIYIKSLHGLTDQQYGSVFLGQLIFAIVGALLAGPAVMRMSLKMMYAIALLCLFASQVCLAISHSADRETALWLIKIALSFFGFGFGFGGGPLNGIVPLLFPNRVNSAITGIHMMAGLGLSSGPLYFRVFEAGGNWVLGPTGLAITALVLFCVHLIFVDKDKPQVEVLEGGAAKPRDSLYFWSIVLISFVYALVEGIFSNWAAIFVNESKGLSEGTAAASLSGFWAGVTVGRLLTTFLVAKFDAFVLWISLPILMILAFWMLPYVANDKQAIYAFVYAGLAVSAFFPLMVSVAASPFPQSVSWIASMLTASLMCGVGVGAYIIGGLIGRTPMESVYHWSIVLPVIIIVLMLLSKRCRPPSNRVSQQI